MREIPISCPLILDDDDLRIIRSALMKCRKSSGSVRADRIIAGINHQLGHPDTHKLVLPD